MKMSVLIGREMKARAAKGALHLLSGLKQSWLCVWEEQISIDSPTERSGVGKYLLNVTYRGLVDFECRGEYLKPIHFSKKTRFQSEPFCSLEMNDYVISSMFLNLGILAAHTSYRKGLLRWLQQDSAKSPPTSGIPLMSSIEVPIATKEGKQRQV